MTPELKARWLAALKSGDYPKTKGTLKNEQGYCCFGVLAYEASTEIVEGGSKICTYRDHIEVDDFVSRLPDRVIYRLGIEDSEASRLMEINDSTISFQGVIEFIEKNL